MITPTHRTQADALLALLLSRYDTAHILGATGTDRAAMLEATMAFETLRQRACDLIAKGMASEAGEETS